MQDRLWHKNWPKDLPWSLQYPEVGVDIIMRSAAYKFPNHAAFVFKDIEYSYEELWDGAQRFAAALADLNIGKGDVVATHIPNCPQFAIAYYGILLSGAIYSPINPMMTVKELQYLLNDSKAKVIVTYDLFVHNVLNVKDDTNLKNVIVTSNQEAVERVPSDFKSIDKSLLSMQKLLDQYPPHAPRTVINPQTDLAHLAYTGGTTGVSKGVMLTHYNVVANTVQAVCWYLGGYPVLRDGILYIEGKYMESDESSEFVEQEGKETIINVAPLYHTMGTVGYLNGIFGRGYTQILHQHFDPVKYLDDAEKYQVTFASGAPTVFLALLSTPGFEERNLDSVKIITSGAAPMSVELLNKLNKAFPNAIIAEGYGLTEATMGVSANPTNLSGLRKVGSVGIPLFDTEVKIVDLETGEQEKSCGQEGEICIQGPQCMLGYLNRPEETAKVLKGGWVYTGDIGMMDDDGFITIVDRKKDMLIYKGYNVYPREIEELLFQHPAVANCAVIGIIKPDLGELPKAIVVKRAGFDVTAQELMDFVNEQVVFYKKIRELEFLDEIPVSAAGKVLKKNLRDRERKLREEDS